MKANLWPERNSSIEASDDGAGRAAAAASASAEVAAVPAGAPAAAFPSTAAASVRRAGASVAPPEDMQLRRMALGLRDSTRSAAGPVPGFAAAPKRALGAVASPADQGVSSDNTTGFKRGRASPERARSSHADSAASKRADPAIAAASKLAGAAAAFPAVAAVSKASAITGASSAAAAAPGRLTGAATMAAVPVQAPAVQRPILSPPAGADSTRALGPKLAVSVLSSSWSQGKARVFAIRGLAAVHWKLERQRPWKLHIRISGDNPTRAALVSTAQLSVYGDDGVAKPITYWREMPPMVKSHLKDGLVTYILSIDSLSVRTEIDRIHE